jgi:RNA polymerase sigma factor (sigma-70 family)
VAYRVLGSLSEAEDAVQEAWLRLTRIDAATVDNLGGWLTTVVSRVCLMLRSRKSRREEPMGVQVTEPSVVRGEGADPEGEAVLADSVGVALLVVLDMLTPAERLAFVLHDLFGMPFDEIGSIVGRSPAAVKQLASRARRRVRGSPAPSDAGRARQREVVEAFLRAVRAGDLEGLLAVLDPDAVVRIDGAHRCGGSGCRRHGARAQGRFDVGETDDRAFARAAIRTAGADQWTGRIDPRAARQAVPGTDLHLRERQGHAGRGHWRPCSPSRARYRRALDHQQKVWTG